jgi:hypothetical protein
MAVANKVGTALATLAIIPSTAIMAVSAITTLAR